MLFIRKRTNKTAFILLNRDKFKFQKLFKKKIKLDFKKHTKKIKDYLWLF